MWEQAQGQKWAERWPGCSGAGGDSTCPQARSGTWKCRCHLGLPPRRASHPPLAPERRSPASGCGADEQPTRHMTPGSVAQLFWSGHFYGQGTETQLGQAKQQKGVEKPSVDGCSASPRCLLSADGSLPPVLWGLLSSGSFILRPHLPCPHQQCPACIPSALRPPALLPVCQHKPRGTPSLEQLGPQATRQVSLWPGPQSWSQPSHGVHTVGLVSTQQLGGQVSAGWEPVFLQAFRRGRCRWSVDHVWRSRIEEHPGSCLLKDGDGNRICTHAPPLHTHVRCLGWVVAAVRGHVPHLTQHQQPPFPWGALPHRTQPTWQRGAPWDPQALSAFSLKQDLRGHLRCLQTTRQLLSVSPGAGGFAGRGFQPGPSLLLPHQQAHRPLLTRCFSPVSVSRAWSEGAAEARQSPLSPPSPPVLWVWPRPRVTTASPWPTFPPSLHLASHSTDLATLPHGW